MASCLRVIAVNKIFWVDATILGVKKHELSICGGVVVLRVTLIRSTWLKYDPILLVKFHCGH